LSNDGAAAASVAGHSVERSSAVVLLKAGAAKIPLIRVIRAETTLGLRESKHLADEGGVVAYGLSPREADRLVVLLADAGATAERLDAHSAE
jgi:large subunit ribosomal protein L7/L12